MLRAHAPAGTTASSPARLQAAPFAIRYTPLWEVQQDSGRSAKSPCESQRRRRSCRSSRSPHAHTSVQSLLRADLKDCNALAPAPVPELPPARVVDGSVALHRACKRTELGQFHSEPADDAGPFT